MRTSKSKFYRGTALFCGSVRDELNTPLVGIELFASDNSDEYKSDGWSDLNGNYAVAASATNWCIEVGTDDPAIANYVVAQSHCDALNNGQALLANFSARRATNHITGYVRDNLSNPIVGVSVYANANINGTNFRTVYTTTDGNGNYTLNVANGTWQVSVHCGCTDCDDSLDAKGYQCVNDQQVPISGNNGAANFIAQGLTLTALNRTGNQFQLRLTGATGQNYTVQFSTNLANSNWFSLLTTNLSAASVTILDPNATNAARFYRTRVGP